MAGESPIAYIGMVVFPRSNMNAKTKAVVASTSIASMKESIKKRTIVTMLGELDGIEEYATQTEAKIFSEDDDVLIAKYIMNPKPDTESAKILLWFQGNVFENRWYAFDIVIQRAKQDYKYSSAEFKFSSLEAMAHFLFCNKHVDIIKMLNY
jgi:hypothetical protein